MESQLGPKSFSRNIIHCVGISFTAYESDRRDTEVITMLFILYSTPSCVYSWKLFLTVDIVEFIYLN